MPFTADLNPKGSKSMDLLDMVKMEDYLERRRAFNPTKPAGKSAVKPNNMLKSGPDDIGTEFRFNSNQNANDTTG
jgi:hypothetical protein